MINKLFFTSFVFLASSAYAGEKVDILKPKEDLCEYVLDYSQAVADPSVAYKGGETFPDGTPVPSANLTENNQQIEVPDEVSFDLTIDMLKNMGILDLPEGIEVKPNLGHVTVDKNGNISFNGKPLGGEDNKKLKDFCIERLNAGITL